MKTKLNKVGKKNGTVGIKRNGNRGLPYNMEYEELPHKSGERRSLVSKSIRMGASVTGRVLSKAVRHVSPVARIRAFKRISRIEDQLRAPWIHDDNGLEKYIEMLIKQSKPVRRSKK